MSMLSEFLKAATGKTAAIPRGFESALIKRVAEKLGGFPKKARGPEILEALEGRGTLPQGYGEFYRPRLENVVPSGFSLEEMMSHPSHRLAEGFGVRPESTQVPTRDELIPFLQHQWPNPRVDVKRRQFHGRWNE
jgi:hypothetical protein